jgi:hypothetical protein
MSGSRFFRMPLIYSFIVRFQLTLQFAYKSFNLHINHSILASKRVILNLNHLLFQAVSAQGAWRDSDRETVRQPRQAGGRSNLRNHSGRHRRGQRLNTNPKTFQIVYHRRIIYYEFQFKMKFICLSINCFSAILDTP